MIQLFILPLMIIPVLLKDPEVTVMLTNNKLDSSVSYLKDAKTQNAVYFALDFNPFINQYQYLVDQAISIKLARHSIEDPKLSCAVPMSLKYKLYSPDLSKAIKQIKASDFMPLNGSIIDSNQKDIQMNINYAYDEFQSKMRVIVIQVQPILTDGQKNCQIPFSIGDSFQINPQKLQVAQLVKDSSDSMSIDIFSNDLQKMEFKVNLDFSDINQIYNVKSKKVEQVSDKYVYRTKIVLIPLQHQLNGGNLDV